MSSLITVLDTVQPQNMTLNSSYQAVLAYRDGLYRWTPQQVQRFLAAGKLVYPVTVIGNDPHEAQMADCERGDLTPAGAAKWAFERNDLHHDATIYASLANVPVVVDALGTEPCWLWVADWTGKVEELTLNLPPQIKFAAEQYATSSLDDISAIMSSAWPASPWKGTDW
jgi:hypothetical protein